MCSKAEGSAQHAVRSQEGSDQNYARSSKTTSQRFTGADVGGFSERDRYSGLRKKTYIKICEKYHSDQSPFKRSFHLARILNKISSASGYEMVHYLDYSFWGMTYLFGKSFLPTAWWEKGRERVRMLSEGRKRGERILIQTESAYRVWITETLAISALKKSPRMRNADLDTWRCEVITREGPFFDTSIKKFLDTACSPSKQDRKLFSLHALTEILKNQ